MKTVKVRLTTERKSAGEFVDAWKRAERGEAPEKPVERLYFLDAETMLKVLSRQRLALLSELRRDKAARVVDLARRLGRNYKNVYDDVKLLKRAGLIEEDERGTFVKFDRIRADIDLAA
ncbi:MAG: hypothetical protein EXR29_15425 [Betaproteobacteria bacterium]|nr:hypothetical protein [Betaproteobacteria bacterium]